MTKCKQLLMGWVHIVHFAPGPSFSHFGSLVGGCVVPVAATVPLPDGPASLSRLPP